MLDQCSRKLLALWEFRVKYLLFLSKNNFFRLYLWAHIGLMTNLKLLLFDLSIFYCQRYLINQKLSQKAIRITQKVLFSKICNNHIFLIGWPSQIHRSIKMIQLSQLNFLTPYFSSYFLSTSFSLLQKQRVFVYYVLKPDKSLMVFNHQSGCSLFFLQYLKMHQKKAQKQAQQPHQAEYQAKRLNFQKKQLSFNQYSICRPYPKQNSPLSLAFITVTRLFYLLNITITSVRLVPIKIPQKESIEQLLIWQEQSLGILFIISLLIKTTIITGILLDHRYYQSKTTHKLLMRFIQFLRSYLRIMVELDFQSSAFLMATETALMSINFGLSVTIVSFSLLFLENYCYRRDSFYIGCIAYYFLLRFNVAFGSVVNFFCLILKDNTVSFYCFLVIHTFLTIFQSISYLSGGCFLYRDPILRWGTLLQAILYDSLVINFWISLWVNPVLMTFLIHMFLTLSILSIKFYLRLKDLKIDVISHDTNMQLLAYYLFQLLEQSGENTENTALVNGLFAAHTNMQCMNPQCYANNPSLYDSKIKLTFQTDQIYRNRSSLLNYYLKCKFETFLQQESQNLDLMLSYSEFLYYQFNNVGLCMYWLKKLSSNRDRLGLSTKIKLNGLLRLIRDDNISYYGTNFQIQNLIEAEQINKYILHQTFQILHEKENLWMLLQSSQINLGSLKIKAEKIRSMIDDNSEQWKTISDYVHRSKQWKFQYLCFALFLKNEQIKSKTLEKLNSVQKECDQYEQERKISKIDMFDEKSCTLHTFIHNGQIFIKQVSKNFINVTGYSKPEVLLANLEALMPKFIAKSHQKLMISMSLQGRLTAENIKTNKQIYIVHKEGYVLPVLKIFKEFISKTGELEYICFLKKMPQDECVFICDPCFEIKAFTKKSIDTITDNYDGDSIKKMNLITFMPQLVSLSSFKDSAGVVSNELISSVKLLSRTIKKRETNEQIETELQLNVGQRQQPLLFKSSALVKLIYPNIALSNFADSYEYQLRHTNKQNMEQYHSCINKYNKKIEKSGYQTFYCKLQIHQVRNSCGIHFYEVKLKQLHNSCVTQEFDYQLRKTEEEEQSAVIMPIHPREQNFNRLGKPIIKTSDNIFIKEQSNRPKESNIYINYLKAVIYCGFFLLMLSVVIDKFMLDNTIANMNSTINNFNSTIQVSIVSNQLFNLYLAKFLNINDDPTLIKELTSQIQAVINSPQIRKIIYDPAVNTPNNYSSLQDQRQLNHIDLLYTIESCLQTLSQPDFLFLSSREYQLLMNYQFPALDNFLRSIKQNIFVSFKNCEKNMQLEYIAIFTSQIFILTTALILILLFSYKFFASMQEMMKIHCQFSPKELKKIRKYMTYISSVFEQIEGSSTKQKQLRQMTRKSQATQLASQFINYTRDPNLNKRSKTIFVGQKMSRSKLLYFGKVIFFYLLLLSMIITRNIYFQSYLDPIDRKIGEGKYFFQNISTHYLTAQVMAHAYLPQAIPFFNSTIYQSILIDSLSAIIHEPYIGTDSSASFTQRFKKFYYSDACQVGLNFLKSANITLEQCQTVAKHSLKSGFREYSIYQRDNLLSIFNNEMVPSIEIVEDYFRSINIYHEIHNGLIYQCVSQFNTFTQYVLFNIHAITYAAFFLLIITSLLAKINIIDFLKMDYDFNRFFYNSMMPEFIVSQEKIIRSSLVVIQFL